MEEVLPLIGVTACDAGTPRGAGEEELLKKARDLAGYRLGEIAARVGHVLPESLLRNKGAAGRVIETALGAHPTATLDFEALGVECKTVPVRPDGRPRESTFLISLSPHAELGVWMTSPARRKIARVLFVPVEIDPAVPLALRRVGRAFLWSPSAALERLFEEDFEALGERLARQGWGGMSGHVGIALQTRPKAARASVRVRGLDSEGFSEPVHPRALYLRPWVTARAIDDCIGPEDLREPSPPRYAR